MSEEQKNNVPLIGEIFVEGEAPPQYYQAFLDAQAKAEEAAGRAEDAVAKIVVDQEFIETQVFSAGQSAEISATAARDAQTAAGAAAQSEKNTKDDADRAAGAADDAAEALQQTKEVADSVDSPVSYKPQTLPEKEKAQAKENIGASTFYHTKRKKLGDEYEDTEKYQSDYIFGLYDALMAEYSDNVQRKEHTNDDDTFTNYEYVISTRGYTDVNGKDGQYVGVYGNEPPIKKPKYLVLSGIHGRERKTVFSTYRFVRDLLSGHNIPTAFREGVMLSVMPVGTPSAFDAFTKDNENGVNINRNFNAENPEKETQAIQKWLNANADADLFIDFHNNEILNEKVLILGLPDNSTSNTARKIALRGVDHIIPFWRDVIGYPDKVETNGVEDTDGDGSTVEVRDVIYSYTATIDTNGLSIKYAQNVVGIPSITLEAVSFYGSYTEWQNNKKADSPEAVAMGAEALGNILIEFYKNEVNNMAGIDQKLDQLLQSASFRIEHGTMRGDSEYITDYYNASGVLKGKTITIPCSANPKLILFKATEATQAKIASLTAAVTFSGYCTYAIIFNNIIDLDEAGASADSGRNCLLCQFLLHESNNKVYSTYGDGTLTDMDTAPKTNVGTFYTGDEEFDAEYEWTAYYWDE